MNKQYLEVYAGENRTLTLYARDNANNVFPLGDQNAIEWRVGRPPFNPEQKGATFVLDGTVIDGPNGVFTVAVEPSDTSNFSGNFAHVALSTEDGTLNFLNSSGDVLVFLNAQGDPLRFVNQTDGNVTVLTQGTLKVIKGIQA